MGRPARQVKEKRDLLGAEVGQRIRRARLERGMSLAAVGGDDLSRSFLSLVELGRSRISLRALAIVAERLELPIGYFLEDTPGAAGVVELAIDQAAVALARQEASECLRILDGLDVSDRQRGRLLALRGRALLKLGKPREAVQALREALELESGSADFHSIAELRYSLGAALYSSGAFDEALVHLRRALDELASEPLDPALVGKITVTIGHVLSLRDDPGAAMDYYDQAREHFGVLGDLSTLGAIYSGLSAAHERRGDIASALRYSKLSLGAFEAQQNAYQAARELNNMANAYRELGQLDQALAQAAESAQRAHVIGAADVEAAANSTLAQIHLAMGEFERAAVEALLADELAPNDAFRGKVGVWSVQATLAERDGKHELADTLYRKALDTLEESGQRAEYADIALQYSLVLRQRGDVEEALELALQAAQAKARKTG
ncbi:MAG TPA: helix-turn-helix domain-containing protein [Chloroflexota bacterium]|nr:helix-turn-helix domain-containing protein [Chloroflexota bacterium]